MNVALTSLSPESTATPAQQPAGYSPHMNMAGADVRVTINFGDKSPHYPPGGAILIEGGLANEVSLDLLLEDLPAAVRLDDGQSTTYSLETTIIDHQWGASSLVLDVLMFVGAEAGTAVTTLMVERLISSIRARLQTPIPLDGDRAEEYSRTRLLTHYGELDAKELFLVSEGTTADGWEFWYEVGDTRYEVEVYRDRTTLFTRRTLRVRDPNDVFAARRETSPALDVTTRDGVEGP